jgi:heat-inducible transcriptional repressor
MPLTDNLILLKFIMLTQRQQQILKNLIEDYVELAMPISSDLFEKRHDFGITSPTIRLEFQKLTKEGFLKKPHISAGRIPTDKAYRYFVDNLLKEEIFEIENLINVQTKDKLKFFQILTKNLANLSKCLILSYFEKERSMFKEGWEEILKEPEFTEREYILKFLSYLEDFERKIENLNLDSDVKVFIGRENPFKKGSEFTLILSKFTIDSSSGILALFGPKRMNYNKNVGLMKSFKNFVEKYVRGTEKRN